LTGRMRRRLWHLRKKLPLNRHLSTGFPDSLPRGGFRKKSRKNRRQPNS
jgi:hypothetical protein